MNRSSGAITKWMSSKIKGIIKIPHFESWHKHFQVIWIFSIGIARKENTIYELLKSIYAQNKYVLSWYENIINSLNVLKII